MEYNDTILTFDTLYTTNEIQLLKLALPLLSVQLQPVAATLIKMRELEYCLSRLPHTKIRDFSIAIDKLDTFFDSAMPFCNQQQKKLFSQLRRMKQSMKMMEKMQTILQMLPPDAMPFSENGNTADPDALSHMFEIFSAMQHMSGTASDSGSVDPAMSGQHTSDNNSAMESILGSMLSPAQKESYQRFKEAFSSNGEQNMDGRPASASD